MKLKIALFIAMVSVTNIFATHTYSQVAKVSLDMENKTLEQVMDEIERQSEFYFIFNQKEIDVNRFVDIQIKNMLIGEVLPILFEGTDVHYIIFDRKILLTTDLLGLDILGNNSLANVTQQQITVSGIITDASTGQPMPGVNILVKGTSIGALADANGRYKIDVPSSTSVLVFSFIGYESQEIPIAGRTVVDLALSSTLTSLDEVIVIGYGTMKKKDFTGSVSSVNTEKVADERPQNLQEILKTTIAGLEVGTSYSAKGGGSLQIRGNNTLKSSSDPLLVVDGVIYQGSIEDINPYDIQSIDVLKDASSAAVYGSRSANGVILITTNKGTLGKPMINFNVTNGLITKGTIAHLYKGEEFILWRQDVLKSQNRYNPVLMDKLYIFDNPDNLPEGVSMDEWYNGLTGDPQVIWLNRLGMLAIEQQNYAEGKSIDWEDKVFQKGFRQDYNLSMSGKKDEVNYYWSIGYNDNEGIVYGDEFTTIRSRVNLEGKIKPWLLAGLNTQFAYRDESSIPVRWQDAEFVSPWGNCYNDDGTLAYWATEDNMSINPLYDRAFQSRLQTYKTLVSNLYTEVKLPLGITYRLNFSPRAEWSNYMNHTSALHQQTALTGGRAERRHGEIFAWQVDHLIKWNKIFNNIHQIDVTLLANAEKFQSWSDRMSISGFSPTDALGYHNFTAGSSSQVSVSSDDQYDTGNALMARIFYSFKDRYMITATMRRDGYSAFGAANPYGYFPSVALGWVFTEENFLKNDIIPYGKLRLSWGENGNRQIGRYSALSQMGLAKYIYQTLGNSTYETNILSITTMQNSELAWEKTRSFNVGLDFQILKSIDGSIEFYKSSTMDLLVDRSLPDIIGISSVASNLGELSNTGFEMDLNARIMDKENFIWRTSFSFALNRNKIVHLYGDMVDVTDNAGNVIGEKEADDITNLWFIDHAIDEIWDPVVLGVWQIDEAAAATEYDKYPGDFKIKDGDNNGIINYDDFEFQGFTVPRFRWNLRQELNIYKNLDLSFVLYSLWGHKGKFNQAKNNDRYYPDRINGYNVPYWTPENPTNDYARIGSSYAGTFFNVWRDKSFIRLENITLAYSVPKTLLNKVKISSLSIIGTIRNAGWWAPHWKHSDPEAGILYGTYVEAPQPNPRHFTLGINLTL